MARKRSALLTAFLAIGVRIGEANAAEPEPVEEALPPALLGVGAGAATSVAFATVGSTILTTSNDQRTRNAAFLGLHGGLCLAPIVSHLVVGELGRGAMFALVPTAATVGLGLLFTKYPDFLSRSPSPIQWATSTFISLAVAGSAVGVIDTAWAGERARTRARSRGRIHLTPIIDRAFTGAIVAGTL